MIYVTTSDMTALAFWWRIAVLALVAEACMSGCDMSPPTPMLAKHEIRHACDMDAFKNIERPERGLKSPDVLPRSDYRVKTRRVMRHFALQSMLSLC